MSRHLDITLYLSEWRIAFPAVLTQVDIDTSLVFSTARKFCFTHCDQDEMARETSISTRWSALYEAMLSLNNRAKFFYTSFFFPGSRLATLTLEVHCIGPSMQWRNKEKASGQNLKSWPSHQTHTTFSNDFYSRGYHGLGPANQTFNGRKIFTIKRAEVGVIWPPK